MIGAHALLGREVTEHMVRLIVRSTHPVTPFSKWREHLSTPGSICRSPNSYFFITLLDTKQGFERRPTVGFRFVAGPSSRARQTLDSVQTAKSRHQPAAPA